MKTNAVILSDKAIREIILALRSARRSTERERAYLRWLIETLKEQTGE